MFTVSEEFLRRIREGHNTPNGRCWECPIRDGQLVCDPAISLRCPMRATADEAAES